LFARIRSTGGDEVTPAHLADAPAMNGANGIRTANGVATVDAEEGDDGLAGVETDAEDAPATDAADAPDAETTAMDAADAGPDVDDAIGADEAPADGPAPTADRVELHKRDALLAGSIRDLNRQLKLALSDQQNGLLEAVRGRRSPKSPTGPVIPEPSELAGAYQELARRELAAAAQLGWRAVAPDDTTPGDVDVADLADGLADALARDLSSRLQRDDGTDDDDQHLAERVRAAYRELRSQRLGDVTTHHVLTAFGMGQLAAAPDGSRARWVYDTCGPDCLDNALAGPLAFGEAFPTGHTYPPAFEGCRCLLVAVEADVADDD
jgi:hypothetical protein